jgi:hypothetical protein
LSIDHQYTVAISVKNRKTYLIGKYRLNPVTYSLEPTIEKVPTLKQTPNPGDLERLVVDELPDSSKFMTVEVYGSLCWFVKTRVCSEK